MIQKHDPRSPGADLIPGDVDLFVVLAEDDRVAVILDRVRAQPAGFEFDLLMVGQVQSLVRVMHPGAVEGSAGLRAFAASALGEEPPVLDCGVQFAGKGPGPVEARLHMKSGFSRDGETDASFWVRPLPPVGDVIFTVTVGDLTGSAVISGNDLRSAATRARRLGASGR
ncbi:hypothetical protein [Parafrankia sp. EUN1f]|uniref:hypothetical protein n=1 Tax=Parafrankia sp. EUN1f TaxID=102897 RepID=UPI0001C45ACC|nr:hypothetical protein [Parafrankia sp. EUN1f]EFC81975.1 hypothetical protein FrEUN1fDRAFT_4925 [Parafrankia sp. EUN1f]